jgi:hypothetical protein
MANRSDQTPGRLGDSNAETERRPGDDPRARAAWFLRTRSDADGNVLRGIYLEASRQRHRIHNDPARPYAVPGPPGSVNWTPLGPSAIKGGWIESGRITTIAAGPGGSRVYAGAANGGVWFSADGGASWSPLDDYVTSPSLTGGATEADSLAIGALAVSFGASAIGDDVYVGTGDPNSSYDAYFGIGIRHLVSGTWSLEATNLASHGIFDIVVDPNDPATVLAATTVGLFRRPASGNMATWAQVTSPAFQNSSGPVSALIVVGSGATKAYYAALEGDNVHKSAVYKSADSVTWTALSGLAGAGRRIALAGGESDPSAVYALGEDATLSRLQGTTFSTVPGLPKGALFLGNQGWYDIAIAVDPSDGDTIYLGGDRISLFKGTLTGSPGSWTFPFNSANAGTPTADPTWVGSGIHPDVHACAFGLNAAGTAHDPTNVWVGSDGGMFQSTASGTAGTFQARNLGLAITEFSYLTQRADTDAVAFAGAQDNGTPRLLSEQASSETAGGDGGGVTFDPTNPYRVMRQYVSNMLEVTADGGATWSWITFPPQAGQSEFAGFVAPLASVATGPSSAMAAFGTNRLWVTTDWGGSWVTLPTGTNPYASTPPNLTQDVIDGPKITAIAFASATQVFAATFDTAWRYDQAGGTWSHTVIPSTGLPAIPFITALAPDPSASGSFYVSLGGGGVPHVWYFDGTAWHAAMPASVVDVPTHGIAVDPSNPANVYVGTDVGCWKGVRSGTTWSWALFSQGLPECAITDLTVHDSARLLRAATHGRGVWEIELDAAQGLDPDIYLRVNYNDTGRVKAGSRQPWVEGHQDPTHANTANPYTLYHWMSADIKVRRTSLTGLPSLGSPVTYFDFAFNIGDYVDSVLHVETADLSGTDRIFVEVHNRSLTPVPGPQVQVLLLVTDASAGLPALPAGYASQINAGNTSGAWLAGTPWRFVDPSTPYRTLPGALDVRTPQVVEFDLDFSTLGLAAGHDHVCLAAFVTTPTDQITATSTDLNQVTMTDKHVAHRNTHLVAAGITPGTEGGPAPRPHPRTVLVDFHNPTEGDLNVDLVFDRSHFPGELSLMLPKLPGLDPGSTSLSGLEVVEHDERGDQVRRTLGRFLERVGEAIEDLGEDLERPGSSEPRERQRSRGRSRLARLDRSRSFVAEIGAVRPTVSGVPLAAGEALTCAVTIKVPPDATAGDGYRLDVLQMNGQQLVGGSTYIVAVVKD